MMRSLLLAPGTALLVGAVPVRAQQAIPLRSVLPPSAVTSERLGALLGVRQLPGGRVLVDDAGRRRLLLFDSTLTTFSVIADSGTGAANSYGTIAAPLIPYRGDSTLFVHRASQTLLVLDEVGRVARVMSLPRPADLQYLHGYAAAVDTRGRLFMHGSAIFPARPAPGQPAPPPVPGASADSASLLRVDFELRTTDTIGTIKTANVIRVEPFTTAAGERSSKYIVRPITWIDDWTVHADGSVAIVRGQDYHIDWITPDGTRTSSPKMPFDWRHISDEEKQVIADRVVDSLRKDDALKIASGRGGIRFQMNGATREVTKLGPAPPREFGSVPLSEIPDYHPPIRNGSVKADLDGNIWILPYTSAQSRGGGLVYDVANRKGELIERVELPKERSIVGFGPGGTVYLMWRDAGLAWHLERTRVRR